MADTLVVPTQPSAEAERPVRTIAVMMPFGGSDVRLQRFYKLHFNRIRENIEVLEEEEKARIEKKHKIEVNPERDESDLIDQQGPAVGLERADLAIDYHVEPFYTSVHSVPLEGLKAIVDADILVALVSGHNINVIYEIGIRQVVKGDTVLLVEGDANHELPVYLRHQGYIAYETPDPTVVGKAIQALCEIEFPSLITADFGEQNEAITGIMRSLIRDHDTDLRKKIGEALKEIEFSVPADPPEIAQLFRSVDPSRIVGVWDAYFPYCVTRVKWRHRSMEEAYAEDDLDEKPVVCSANRAFENLFDIARAGGIPDPDSSHRVTLSSLIYRLRDKGYMKPATYDRFAAEQRRLYDVLLFRCETDWATTPLVLDGEHFHPYYHRAEFIPAAIAKWTIGDVGGPHEDYYLVGFIRTDHNGTGQLGD